MKFLTLMALPVSLLALTTFKTKDELIQCIMDCQEFVSPCVSDQPCQKSYIRCMNHEDPFTCLSSINHPLASKIIRCFDQQCQELEQVEEVSGQEIDSEDAAEMAQFEEGGNDEPPMVGGSQESPDAPDNDQDPPVVMTPSQQGESSSKIPLSDQRRQQTEQDTDQDEEEEDQFIPEMQRPTNPDMQIPGEPQNNDQEVEQSPQTEAEKDSKELEGDREEANREAEEQVEEEEVEKDGEEDEEEEEIQENQDHL